MVIFVWKITDDISIFIIVLTLSITPLILHAKEGKDPLSAYPLQQISKNTWVILGPREIPNKAN